MSKKQKVFTTQSGETLPLLPVSEVDLTPFINQLTKGAPKPPVEMIEGVGVPNEAHPDYLEALQEFNINKSAFIVAVYMEYGLDLELDEDQQRTVDKAKKKMERVNPGAPENKFDLYVYAKTVCPTMEELTRLMEAIQSINNPTAQQVQAHLDNFRPDVPGAAAYGDKNAPQWNRIPDWEPEIGALPGGEMGGLPDGLLLRNAGA